MYSNKSQREKKLKKIEREKCFIICFFLNGGSSFFFKFFFNAEVVGNKKGSYFLNQLYR